MTNSCGYFTGGGDLMGLRGTSVVLTERQELKACEVIASYVAGDERQRVLAMLGLDHHGKE